MTESSISQQSDYLQDKRFAKKSDRWPLHLAASDILFLLLLGFNVVRELSHAMWRDELQIFLLGANSRTLVDLWIAPTATWCHSNTEQNRPEPPASCGALIIPSLTMVVLHRC